MSYQARGDYLITANSTQAALTASSTFTGSWQETSGFSNIKLQAICDEICQVYIEFSPDESRVITDPPLGYTVGNNAAEGVVTASLASYFRIRIVCGATSQTYLSVQTFLTNDTILKTSPLNKRIGRDETSVVTRPSNHAHDIHRGLYSGVEVISKFAYRTDIDTADSDALIIADDTTNTPTILTTASTFTIAYDSSTDGSGTTGALTLLISYLDSDENMQEELHTLGGTGSDVTSFSGLGVNRVVVTSSGTANVNTNDITVTATTGGSVQAFVPAGISVTQQLWVHIPQNYYGICDLIQLSGQKLSGGSTPRLQFKIFVFNRGTETVYEIMRENMDTDVLNEIVISDPVGIRFSPRDVFWITCKTDTNNATAASRAATTIYAID